MTRWSEVEEDPKLDRIGVAALALFLAGLFLQELVRPEQPVWHGSIEVPFFILAGVVLLVWVVARAAVLISRSGWRV